MGEALTSMLKEGRDIIIFSKINIAVNPGLVDVAAFRPEICAYAKWGTAVRSEAWFAWNLLNSLARTRIGSSNRRKAPVMGYGLLRFLPDRFP